MIKARMTKTNTLADTYASSTMIIDEYIIDGVEKSLVVPPAGNAAVATALKTAVQQITGES